MGNFYIQTVNATTWKSQLAHPEKQWKQGYSAYELAHHWERANGFPPAVLTVLKQQFEKIELLYGFPEYEVALPGGRTNSQNDLYILAKSEEHLIPIMIEGKVNEPFGETVEKWLGPSPSEGKKIRLAYLVNLLHLTNDISHIRYQLLHRTASAIIEANKVNAKHAIVIIHSFSPTNKSYKDFEAFVELFHLKATQNQLLGPIQIDGTQLFFSWVADQCI